MKADQIAREIMDQMLGPMWTPTAVMLGLEKQIATALRAAHTAGTER